MEAFKRDEKVTRITKATAMGFGAALASNYCAPELSAAIVTLDFTPGSVPFTTGSPLVPVQINTSGGKLVGGFSQWNDSEGKTMNFSTLIASWSEQVAGDTIDPADFSGKSFQNLNFSYTQTGTRFVAFRALPGNGGGVGWFAFVMGDSGDTVSYGRSQFSEDEELTVGATTGAVPEPGSATIGLSLLALGAIGLRRRRAKSSNCEAVTAT